VPGRLQISVDCVDPVPLAVFWAAALGYQVEDPPAGFVSWNEYYRSLGVPDEELDDDQDAADSIVDPAGRGPRIRFEPVPERKSVKNRLHFDLKVADRSAPVAERMPVVDAEADRLIALGARVLRRVPPGAIDHYFVVLADPEGNEFCVA
jgi:hypothetical protein